MGYWLLLKQTFAGDGDYSSGASSSDCLAATECQRAEVATDFVLPFTQIEARTDFSAARRARLFFIDCDREHQVWH